MEFEGFPKIPRLFRDIVITEKLDGTNAQILIDEDGTIQAASRKRLITPEDDNFGFAAWVKENADELRGLGPGRHFGEWWGAGIGRRYDQTEKHFSLFNAGRWTPTNPAPSCCRVVPVLYKGPFITRVCNLTLEDLTLHGSQAAPGFMRPEGIIVYHTAGRVLFKATIEHDTLSKTVAQQETH